MLAERIDNYEVEAPAPANEVPEEIWIPAVNLESFEKSFGKLVKVAKKLNMEPPVWKEKGREDRVWKMEKEMKWVEENGFKFEKIVDVPVYMEWINIEFDGLSPKLAGWDFVAKADYESSDIPLLLITPGKEVPTEFFRAPSTRCDHCNRKHARKTCYVVESEDEGFKFVGSSCLKDFLGHVSPEALARYWGYLSDLDGFEEVDEESYGNNFYSIVTYPIEKVLIRAAAAIRLEGWKPASARYENIRPTSGDVNFALTPLASHLRWITGRNAEEAKREVTAEWNRLNETTEKDEEAAKVTIEWLAGLDIEKVNGNNYLLNLINVRDRGFVEYKSMGLMVSAVNVALKEERKKTEKESYAEKVANSEHVGSVKERIEFKDAELLSEKAFEGTDYMTGGSVTKYIYNFLSADGNVLVVFPTDRFEDLEIGTTYTFKGTVKKHDSFNNVKNTVLNRLAFAKKK